MYRLEYLVTNDSCMLEVKALTRALGYLLGKYKLFFSVDGVELRSVGILLILKLEYNAILSLYVLYVRFRFSSTMVFTWCEKFVNGMR